MSVADIRQYVKNNSPVYVPPISWYSIGRKAFQRGEAFSELWHSDMQRGWLAARGE